MYIYITAKKEIFFSGKYIKNLIFLSLSLPSLRFFLNLFLISFLNQHHITSLSFFFSFFLFFFFFSFFFFFFLFLFRGRSFFFLALCVPCLDSGITGILILNLWVGLVSRV